MFYLSYEGFAFTILHAGSGVLCEALTKLTEPSSFSLSQDPAKCRCRYEPTSPYKVPPNGNLRNIPHLFCRASAPSREWTAHKSSRSTGTIGKKISLSFVYGSKCFHINFYQVDWSTSRCPHLLQSAGLACLRGQNFGQPVFSHLMLIFSLQTYDKLRTYLLKAIQECSEGFGFA